MIALYISNCYNKFMDNEDIYAVISCNPVI
ncbi:MAG: hypothetical protein H6Q96_282 [Nitrospirae bacterium]|nr:hypothetical protein [Nitrospirota bacterium]